jgi:hypothetical protein
VETLKARCRSPSTAAGCSARRRLTEAIPLVEEIVRLARLVEKASPSRGYREGEQLDDSTGPNGAEEVVDAAGTSVAKEILALYRQAKVRVEETASLIEAAMGWSIARVERGLTPATNAFRPTRRCR